MDLGLIVPMLIRGDTGDYHDLIVASPKREEEFQRRLERIVEHLSMVNTFTKKEINDSLMAHSSEDTEHVRGVWCGAW